jgi:hypothetical protein
MIRNVVLAVAVFFGALTAASDVYAADLFPLAPGNGWTYRDPVTGATFNIHVGAPVYLNDRVYHPVRGYTVEPVLVRVNEYGNIVYWDEERGQDILLISFEAVPRGWWEAPKRECPLEGQTTGGRLPHDGPAGRWSALEIQYRTAGCADAAEQSEQFVENIGMVRRVVNTFAGPRAYDLVFAKIGTQVITAGNTGRVSLTARPSSSPGFWTVVFRIDLPAGTQLKATFPSTQRYDARLRDSDGRVLWTWSADKLFAQMTHELVLRGGFSASIEVPQPPATPEDPHFYTIEAWLTNAPEEPRFGALTGVDVR